MSSTYIPHRKDQKQYGKKAVLLLQYFTELNEKGKDKAIAAILDLSEVPKYKKG